MARPTDRTSLLDAAVEEFAKLLAAVDNVPDRQREVPGACADWSVKDLLAHLDAWHEMFLGWESDGAAGRTPDMPAAGYRWSDTPALNEEIYERTANDTWDEVMSRFHRSHGRVIEVISSYSDEDLFTKKRYRWTGSTSVGSYAVSATASHHVWAAKLIRSWLKSMGERWQGSGPNN